MKGKLKSIIVIFIIAITLLAAFPAASYADASDGALNLNNLALLLPDTVTVKVQRPVIKTDPSYFPTVTVTNSTGGEINLNGTYNGWCVDTDHIIQANTVYSAYVYSSYEDLPSGLIEYPNNLDLVNWIINQNYVGQIIPGDPEPYNFNDVQMAIWKLLEDNPQDGDIGASWIPAHTDNIIAEANANGEGFVPGSGNQVAIILDTFNPSNPAVHFQTIIIGLKLACIGDFVWNDTNNNGIQDNGEPGVPGVTVNLYNSANTQVGTTVTDASGIYGFTVAPGQYYVEFVLPAGYAFTLKDQGSNDAIDSDADTTTGQTVTTTLSPGQTDLTWDAGLYTPSAAIGDFVWNDTNNNGIQDNGEPGVPRVTVNLYDGSNALVGTTVTDVSGIYGFSNLVPGDYYVQFVLPAGYAFTLKDQGSDDAIDSDADTTTGQTVMTTLSPGETDLTWDAGLYVPAAAIGDFVWNDANHNGIQDNGEPGVPGVTVNLYDGSNALVGTTVTDASGIYGFSNLVPGDYYVQFVLPAGYAFTLKDQGSDDAIDSDADTTTGQTVMTTLSPGETDLTWDAGLYVKKLGKITILKKDNGTGCNDGSIINKPGVTFTVEPNPYGAGILTVVDNDVNDKNKTNGIIVLENVPLGTYKITETAAPAGFVLNATPQIKTIGTTYCEVNYTFINKPIKLGKITILKKDNGTGCNDGSIINKPGVTFNIEPNPYGAGILTVVDNDANDKNKTNGIIVLENVPLGTYKITETAAPAGFVLNATPQIKTIGTTYCEVNYTFINKPIKLGKITILKKDNGTGCNDGSIINKPGVTFTVEPNPYGAGILTVVDNDVNDKNKTNGIIVLENVPLGTYKITETAAPAGFVLNATPQIKTIGTTYCEVNYTFINKPIKLGKITILKKDNGTGCNDGSIINKPGVTFTVEPNPYGAGILTVVDNDVNDKNKTNGIIVLENVPLGTYKITETAAPAGFVLNATPQTKTISTTYCEVNYTFINKPKR